MGKGAGITRVPFNEAKGNLSSFMSDVVRRHSLRLLERGRADREELVAVSTEDLLRGLTGCRLDARVSFDEGDSVIARLPEFGLVVSGKDFDAAIDALHDELLDYCDDFFTDFDFYRHTDRVTHFPSLLRFALTPDDQRRGLLLEEPKEQPTPVRSEGALALAR